MILSGQAEAFAELAEKAGCLPTDLLREYTLTEIQLNARVLSAARAGRIKRVNQLIVSTKDPFNLIIQLLAELLVER